MLKDERAGRAVATERGVAVAGTAAIIGMATTWGLIDPARDAFARLHGSDFRISPQVIETVLRRVGGGTLSRARLAAPSRMFAVSGQGRASRGGGIAGVLAWRPTFRATGGWWGRPPGQPLRTADAENVPDRVNPPSGAEGSQSYDSHEGHKC